MRSSRRRSGLTVTWIGADDPGVVPRVRQFGGVMSRFLFADGKRVAADPRATVPRVMERFHPDVVVIDSLRAYMECAQRNIDHSTDAEAALRPWVNASHAGPALVVLHHPPHDQTRAAHSGAFPGMVDVVPCGSPATAT